MAPCWGNTFRDISYCETLVLPSGKFNISLGFHQDIYFPNGLWEASAPLFLAWNCELRCFTAFPCNMKQEQRMLRRKGQQAEVSLNVHMGANVLLKLWDAVPKEGGMSGSREPLLSGIAEPNSCVMGCVIWLGQFL